MNLTVIDWAIVASYFLLSAGIGLAFTKKGGESLSEYFISGRAVPWWLAGASMVATTFAADTPLVVTGLVSAHGVAGNWLWWNILMSGMLTVFFFARLWRRAQRHDRRRIRRGPLQRQAGGDAARLPRVVSRHPGQPDHPRLGDAGDDQDSHDLARLCATCTSAV